MAQLPTSEKKKKWLFNCLEHLVCWKNSASFSRQDTHFRKQNLNNSVVKIIAEITVALMGILDFVGAKHDSHKLQQGRVIQLLSMSTRKWLRLESQSQMLWLDGRQAGLEGTLWIIEFGPCYGDTVGKRTLNL